MQLLIYTQNISPRKQYIFEVIFDFILGTPFNLTTGLDEFNNYDGPKFSYCKEAIGSEINFIETSLLSENIIKAVEPILTDYDGYKVPFPIKNGLFPFDVFAASFYLISRYEEYLNPVKDAHNRFEGKSSFAFKNGFLAKPVIDEWAIKILDILKSKYPEIAHRNRFFIYQPTLDIDTAYYLKTEKPLKRTLRKIKQSLKGNSMVLYKDPFDVYNEVYNWDKRYANTTMFFMLMNNNHVYDSQEDKEHPLVKQLIKRLDKDFIVGQHPSYLSNDDFDVLVTEKSVLESLVSKGVHLSRQHYLKLTLPETYNNLIKLSIKEDYTMLYADLPGFRASTCTAFLWYNLSDEKTTNLLIQPTAVMDQTLKKYMGLSKEDAVLEIYQLMQNVKNVGGVFVSLWHNQSVSDFGVWKGWKFVYTDMLKKGKSLSDKVSAI